MSRCRGKFAVAEPLRVESFAEGEVSLSASDLAIRRGQIMIYRLFDVAEEISLHQVEKILRDSR